MTSDPEDEAIVIKEPDMKSDDEIIGGNEPEDSSYGDYYVDGNNIEFIPFAIGSEVTISHNLQSSNNLDVPESTVEQGATKAETEISDFVPDEKLIDTEFNLDFEFNPKEIDISEDFLKYFWSVESGVLTDSTNLKESGHPLDPSHDHTDAKQPAGHVDDSSDCGNVDKTTIDIEFSTLSREECEKKVKTRLDLKHSRRWSAPKEARRKAPKSQNSASRRGYPSYKGASRIVQQKWGKEEMGKSISPEIASGAQSPIPSPSSKTSTGRVRMLWRRDSTSSSASLSICSRSELDPINEVKRHKLLGRKSRKKQNELTEKPYLETRAGRKIMLCHENTLPSSVSSSTDDSPSIAQLIEMEKKKLTGKENCRKKNELMQEPDLETRAGRKRKLCHKNTLSTSVFSSTDDSPSIAQLKEREEKKLTGRENRRKQNELMQEPDLETRAGRKRVLCHKKTLSTAQSNLREKKRLIEMKSRRKKIKLMEELRLLIPEVFNQPKTSKVTILILAKQYIKKLEQILERNQEMIEDLKKKNELLHQKLRNLKEEIYNSQ